MFLVYNTKFINSPISYNTANDVFIHFSMKPVLMSLFLCVLCYQPIMAQDEADSSVFFLRDAHANFTIDSVLKKNEAFTLLTNPHFRHDHVPYWFKVSIKNKSDEPQRKIIEVDYAYVDEVSLFIVKNKQLVYESPTIGWQTPYEDRFVKHHNPIFPVNIDPQSEQIIYIKALRKSYMFVVPVKTWNEDQFYKNKISINLLWGGFGGILLFASLLGFILFVSLHQNAYLYYSLYVLTSLIYVFMNKGIFLEYYQNGFLGISGTNIRQLFLNLLLVFVLLFIREYLFYKYAFPTLLGNVFKTCIILNLITITILGFEKFYTFPPFVLSLYTIIILFTVFFSCYLVYYSLRKKIAVQENSIYIIGFAPLGLRSIFSIMCGYGIIPNHWLWNNEGLMLGFMFEILVLSIGLGFRYKNLRGEKEYQQKLVYEGKLKLLHERESISRDLHDNVGSQLSVISSSLDNIGYLSENKKLTPERIETVNEFVREAIQSLRDTIWATHQETFPLPEFRARVQEYIHKYYQSEICEILVNFEENDLTLSSSQTLNLFRIIQEALNNAVKYAQASNISINLRVVDKHILLNIIDNGVGFNIESKKSEPHFGLLNMQKRVNEIIGKLNIKSKQGKGTNIEVLI